DNPQHGPALAITNHVCGGCELADFGGRVVCRDRTGTVAKQILSGFLGHVCRAQSPAKGMAQIVYTHILEAPRCGAADFSRISSGCFLARSAPAVVVHLADWPACAR